VTSFFQVIVKSVIILFAYYVSYPVEIVLPFRFIVLSDVEFYYAMVGAAFLVPYLPVP